MDPDQLSLADMRGNFRTVIMSLSCLFGVYFLHFCGICLSGLVISGPVLRLSHPLAAEFRRKTPLHIARCDNFEELSAGNSNRFGHAR